MSRCNRRNDDEVHEVCVTQTTSELQTNSESAPGYEHVGPYTRLIRRHCPTPRQRDLSDKSHHGEVAPFRDECAARQCLPHRRPGLDKRTPVFPHVSPPLSLSIHHHHPKFISLQHANSQANHFSSSSTAIRTNKCPVQDQESLFAGGTATTGEEGDADQSSQSEQDQQEIQQPKPFHSRCDGQTQGCT